MYTGMIFQYDSSTERGLLMLSNGETKEFGTYNWVDEKNSPAVGQKIAYDNNRVKVATKEDEDAALLKKDEVIDTQEDTQTEEAFNSVDDYIEHYINKEYKLARDSVVDGVRTVSLRMYTSEEYGEVSIKQYGSNIDVTRTLNGKSVH
jgi:hypothetical protein